MLKSIKILQLGDLNLPDWKEDTSSVDYKDKAFSKRIADDLRQKSLANVLRKIHQIATSGNIHAVINMGDYTSIGKTEYIRPAVEIIDALCSDQRGLKPAMLGVPGNHDVSKDEAASLGDAAKFNGIVETFRIHGWVNPPTTSAVPHLLESSDGASLALLLLNTSIGSWSTHVLPASIEAQFTGEKLHEEPLQDTHSDDIGASGKPLPQFPALRNREEQRYHQLDTPYVSHRVINETSNFLQTLERRSAVIIGHHNLLPQRIPRILAYGELLNAGAFRSLLHSSQKTIIYLHGHIHEDPIEQVSAPDAALHEEHQPIIVTISAPLINDGFNEITLFIDESDEQFLLRITKYRLDSNGTIGNFTDQSRVYVPLRRNLADLMTRQVQKTWNLIREAGLASWNELISDASPSLTEADLEPAVLKLFCCGLVNIANLGRPRSQWKLSSKVQEHG